MHFSLLPLGFTPRFSDTSTMLAAILPKPAVRSQSSQCIVLGLHGVIEVWRRKERLPNTPHCLARLFLASWPPVSHVNDLCLSWNIISVHVTGRTRVRAIIRNPMGCGDMNVLMQHDAAGIEQLSSLLWADTTT